jgi:polysaccharide export outer membrane protein
MPPSRKSRVDALLAGFVSLFIGLIAGGCQSAQERYVFSPLPAGITEAAHADDSHTRRLLPGEEITFRFPEGTNYTARVQADGTINMPLIGTVVASGKTLYELTVELHARYVPRFYKHWPPTEYQRVYYVGGQVRQPGRQVYISATTITKTIQSAGDFTDFAARRRVKLTRADGKTITVDCKKAASDSTLDVPVYPGDKIDAPMRDWRDVFD